MPAMILLMTLLISLFTFAKEEPKQENKLKQSGWVMYFMPLQEFPKHTSMQYIREIGVILKQSKDNELKKWKLPKISQNDLNEPVFNRIEWNRMATKLNQYCLKNQAETCSHLSVHRRQYLVRYQKFITDRKKWREEKMKSKSPTN